MDKMEKLINIKLDALIIKRLDTFKPNQTDIG